MVTQLYKEDIPSQRIELLNNLPGLTLVKLVRYSWWNGEETISELGINSNEVFSFCGGPILCYFNTGLVIGASSDSSRSSILLWVEKNEQGALSEDSFEEDAEYVPINSEDNLYSDEKWKQVVGNKIKEIKILKREPKTIKYANLDNEVGLLITMENDIKFILSHGLHDDSGDFSVIFENQIKPGIKEYLQTLDVTSVK